MTKQTRITIQSDSLMLLRGRGSSRTRCPLCDAESEMVALDNLQVISNLEKPQLEEWINSAELHRLQGEGGTTLVCLNSLIARVHKTTTSDHGNETRRSK